MLFEGVFWRKYKFFGEYVVSVSKKIKVCPMCGSRDVYVVDGGVMGMVYRCKQCGYEGSFIVEIDEDEYEDFVKNKNKKSVND